MKPTKNGVHCKDCGRVKMLFETEKKANTFMKFNNEGIKSKNGRSPIRSYFCIYCCGWHLTSKPLARDINTKSRSELILDEYKVAQEKQALMLERNAAYKKQKQEQLLQTLKRIEQSMEYFQLAKESGNVGLSKEIAVSIKADFESIQDLKGSKKPKQKIALFIERVNVEC